LYRLSVHVATRAAPLVARFDKKVARGLDGRRGLAARLAAWAAAQRDTKRPLIWMHAPSVGEGLQAKPVLETLRAEHPDWQTGVHLFFPIGRATRQEPAGRHRRLSAARPAIRSLGGPGRAATDGARLQQARRLARADARRRASRRQAGADFGYGGAEQLAVALAG